MQNNNLWVLLTSVVVFLTGTVWPYNNWDMIGYVASAYHADGYEGAELSQRTFDDVRSSVSKNWFYELTHGPYIEVVYKTPAALEQQLPFYSIRIAYVGLMRAVEPLGLNYSKSSWLVSSFFAVLSVIVLGAIVSECGLPGAAVPAIALAAGFIDLSRLSTPDSMTCFFALSAGYCLLTGRRLVFVISALLPLIRTDAAVLSALLMAYAFWKGDRILPVLSFAFSVAVYLLVNHWHGNYGWLTLFNFTFFKSSPYPAQMVISHNLPDYVKPYLTTLRDLLVEPIAQVSVFALCAYLCFVSRRELARLAGRHLFFTVPVAFIVLRLALFPEYEGRFFVFPATMILVGALTATQAAMRSRPASSPSSV